MYTQRRPANCQYFQRAVAGGGAESMLTAPRSLITRVLREVFVKLREKRLNEVRDLL